MTSVGYEQGFGTVIFFSANSDYLVMDPPKKIDLSGKFIKISSDNII